MYQTIIRKQVYFHITVRVRIISKLLCFFGIFYNATTPCCYKNFTITAQYTPSSTLSGDFYDYIQLKDGSLSLLITDVAGHGYTAGLVAAMVKVAYQETADKATDLCDHQKEINRILVTHVEQIFATALHLSIDTDNKDISVTRAGHLPLLHHRKADGKIVEIAPKGMPFGVLLDYMCECEVVAYEPGDRFFAFTDGVTEEFNAFGHEFGMERLKNFLVKAI